MAFCKPSAKHDKSPEIIKNSFCMCSQVWLGGPPKKECRHTRKVRIFCGQNKLNNHSKVIFIFRMVNCVILHSFCKWKEWTFWKSPREETQISILITQHQPPFLMGGQLSVPDFEKEVSAPSTDVSVGGYYLFCQKKTL